MHTHETLPRWERTNTNTLWRSKIYPVHHVGTDRIYIAPGQESRLGRIYICPAKFLTGLGAGLGAGVGAGLVCGAG